MPPSCDMSEEIYKELLLDIRWEMKDMVEFLKFVQILSQVLKNLINEPFNQKFQKLRLQNPKIKAAFGHSNLSIYLMTQLFFTIKEEYNHETVTFPRVLNNFLVEGEGRGAHLWHLEIRKDRNGRRLKTLIENSRR